MKQLRILIADDHLVVRSGLSTMLGIAKDMKIVGEATDGAEAVNLVEKLKPDVVVMDLMMPVLNGVEATLRIHKDNPLVQILILTTFGTSADIRAALKAGANGAITKNATGQELKAAIRAVAAGTRYVSPEIDAELPLLPEVALSAHEKELLNAVTKGFSNNDIAVMLGISPSTVKQHLSAIFAELGVATRAEAASLALRKQLLKI